METLHKWRLSIRLVLIVAILSALLVSAAFGAQGNTSAIATPGKQAAVPAKAFPSLELPIPQSEQEKGYLGLSGSGTFRIGQIKAPVLLIEVYSFYCPHCQVSAARVNDLYRKIQENPELRDKIKMIGIAVGNSSFEVDSYRERYEVPFPLFSDLNMEMTEKLGVRGTPTFIGVRTDRGEGQPSFYFGEGGFEDAQQFLEKMIQMSGLK
ncbi:MAG: redoxin domain-containing protein [Deltaproteobacteria bacterium]|nr:redoxin domain-containing protein [Deltaproteobacteria bacterium]